MLLVDTSGCSANGVLIRLSRCVNSLYLVSGRLSRAVCHLLVCHCSAPRWRFTRRLTGEQDTRCRSGLSSSDVITIAHRWSGVKWTVERSGTVLPKSLGMTRFLNVLNKGSTDYLTLAPRLSAFAHSIIAWFIFCLLARTGTPAWGETAAVPLRNRLEKFLSKIQPTSTSLYKPFQRSSYMSIYQGAVIRTLERLSDVSPGLSTITGPSSYDTIS